MRVIDRIIKIMESKGITAYKLEKDTGIRQTTFSGWKTGKQAPIEKIEEIIRYLEITPNEAFGYETSKELLTDTELEMLEVLNRMDHEHQIRAIGIVEDYADKHPAGQGKIVSESKIG